MAEEDRLAVRQYSFHLCQNENDFAYLSEGYLGLADAMEKAIDYAFRLGQNKKSGETKGQFICVLDEDGQEVFRTPLAANLTISSADKL